MSVARKFWQKFFEIFCLFLVLIGLTQIFDGASEWQYQFVTSITKLLIAFGVVILISLLIAWFWQKSGKGNHPHRWFQRIISFYTAYQISMYGAAKVLKTQFQAPNYILEQPIGELNGFWLTWAYFGHSQTMALLIGITQIIGSILLLFRSTRLLGIFILIPVMLNINLINHFYDISPLAYYNALHYTFILFFLMLLDYDKLKTVFFSFRERININWKTILLNLARVLVIVAAFWHIHILKSGFQRKTKINGEWQVQSITHNYQTIVPSQWQDSVWTKIYFEWRYGCVFKYHPDKFQDKDLSGRYTIDEKKQTININFYSKDEKTPPDSVQFKYQFAKDSLLNMQGVYKEDSVILALKRIK
jgi:hypothetical protein